MNDQLFETVFEIRLNIKMMNRMSRRANKMSAVAARKMVRAMKAGETEKAHIYAETAQRKKAEKLQYLKLAARMDGVLARIQSASIAKDVAKSLGQATRAAKNQVRMGLVELTQITARFTRAFEDLEVMEKTVTGTLDTSARTMTNPDEVNVLIQEVADANNLELRELLPELVEANARNTRPIPTLNLNRVRDAAT